jgi:integrase
VGELKTLQDYQHKRSRHRLVGERISSFDVWEYCPGANGVKFYAHSLGVEVIEVHLNFKYMLLAASLNLHFTNAEGGPICASYMIQVFKRLLPPGLPRIRFHDLRHTAATIMINNGIPAPTVASILGHSKISMTFDTYSHSTDSQQRRAAALIDDLITPIKLHSNCTQLHSVSQNATEIDESKSVMAENPVKTPK